MVNSHFTRLPCSWHLVSCSWQGVFIIHVPPQFIVSISKFHTVFAWSMSSIHADSFRTITIFHLFVFNLFPIYWSIFGIISKCHAPAFSLSEFHSFFSRYLFPIFFDILMVQEWHTNVFAKCYVLPISSLVLWSFSNMHAASFMFFFPKFDYLCSFFWSLACQFFSLSSQFHAFFFHVSPSFVALFLPLHNFWSVFFHNFFNVFVKFFGHFQNLKPLFSQFSNFQSTFFSNHYYYVDFFTFFLILGRFFWSFYLYAHTFLIFFSFFEIFFPHKFFFKIFPFKILINFAFATSSSHALSMWFVANLVAEFACKPRLSRSNQAQPPVSGHTRAETQTATCTPKTAAQTKYSSIHG